MQIPSEVNPDIVETWITGWTLARETLPPMPDHGGFRVDVGWPDQLVRYVFPSIVPAIAELATTITLPYVFLKACSTPEAMQAVLPPNWVIQRSAWMMVLDAVMPRVRPLYTGYALEQSLGDPVSVVRVLTVDGELAAIGRVVLVREVAIYDRIETQAQHQRRGLAQAVMKQLELIACAQGARNGVLVATPEGRQLYEALGWRMLAPYTTAVIPVLG